MRRSIIFLLAIYGFEGSLLFAQKYSKTFFTVNNGLPQSVVSSLAEDKVNGYLWIATEGGGLAQFDGRTFTTYTFEDGLLSNTIYKVFIDSHNNVWAGTRLGLSKFDGKEFHNFNKLRAVYHHIVEFNDTIFALSRNHSLIKIVHDSVSNANLKNYKGDEIQDILSDSPRWLYLYYTSHLLQRKGLYGTHQIDLSTLGVIYNLFPFGDQINIVSSSGAYTWTLQGLQSVDPHMNYPILLTDKEFKTIWTANRGNITKMTRGGKDDLSVTDTLAINVRILDQITGTERSTWFGTEGKGLVKYSKNSFELIRKGVVTAIEGSGKELWVATRENGLEVSETGQQKKHFDLGRHARVSKIRGFKNGTVWAAGDFGIVKIDSLKNLKAILDSKGFGVVTDIELDDHNRLWIGWKNGLAYTDADKPNNLHPINELSSKWVVCIKYVPYGDRIIVGTTKGMNQIYHGQTKRIVTRFDSIATPSVACYKKKYLIIGSSGRGICIYNLDNGSTKYYSKKNGLASNLIHALNVDEENMLWIGSENGIERIGFDEDLGMQEYMHFSEDHGLTGLESTTLYFNGEEKYFGMVDGVYKFSDLDNPKASEHPLHWTNVELVNSNAQLAEYAPKELGFFHIPENPKLPYNHNSVQFSFAKVFRKYPRATSYKFILMGQDKEWSPPTNAREVTYRNLEPGAYTFKVMARDNYGKWGSTSIQYNFSIAPPFYKTTFFIAFIILFLIGAFVLSAHFYSRRRVMQLLKLEKTRQDTLADVRKEIGIDFHDELGNQLARIINYISLIKINGSKTDRYLAQIEETAKNLIGGTKDFIWALDRLNDSSGSLYVHLKDFGDRLLPEKNIEFRAFYDFPEDISLAIGTGRQINFIFKEALTNAFKHSGSTQVTLRFAKLNAQLEILLTDNGVGMLPDKMNAPNGGIANIKLRSKRINSRLNIHSGIYGTKISLLIYF